MTGVQTCALPILTWTALQTTFTCTGVSAVYQDFKAAIRMKVGTLNPAKDITKLFTHLERLKANQVMIPDYVQGMMLLNAIPDDWDHVAAYYVQMTTAIANVLFTAIAWPFWQSTTALVEPTRTKLTLQIRYQQ